MIIKKLTPEERNERVKIAIEVINDAINNKTSMKQESEKRGFNKDFVGHVFDLIEGRYRNEVTDELVKELENKYDEYYDRPIVLENMQMPERKKPLEKLSKYKFNMLTKTGMCVLIPIKNPKQFKAICSYASNWSKGRGWKFAVRQIDENKMGVWRVDKKIKVTEE